MTNEKLLHALRSTAVDQHRCFGCGYEHNCGIHGCAINRAAAERIGQLMAENQELRRLLGLGTEIVSKSDTICNKK